MTEHIHTSEDVADPTLHDGERVARPLSRDVPDAPRLEPLHFCGSLLW